MKLQRIYVEGLFGQFNHNIPVDVVEGITIIHGPNGYGKTTVLQLTVDILNGRLSEPKRVPFSKFQLDFDDGSTIEVVKADKEGNFESGEVEYTYISTTGDRDRYIPRTEKRKSIAPSMVEEEWPFLQRIGARLWDDSISGHALDYEEVIDIYGSYINPEDLPEWIRRLQQEIPTHIVSANRLHGIGRRKDLERGYHRRDIMTPSVRLYSQELSQAIELKLAESAALSQELDRTFPNRLLRQMVNLNVATTPEEDVIEKKLQELEEKRTRLSRVGVLDNSGESPVQSRETMDLHTRSVLALYIEDTGKKLCIYDELEMKINLLMEILNKRFSNKTVTVGRKNGFVITLHDGSLLSPELLSSGEQHELVLIYDLLFRSKRGSLVMLDEPEISLHIAWQQEFLADMIKIVKLTGAHMIIATHSPDIISGRWDMTVGLGEEDN